MMNPINLIVRALVLNSGHILLVKPSSSNGDFSQELCFLPGGHVEHGESATNALRRELNEELGLDCDIEECVGSLECTWDRKGSLYHELNLIFFSNHPSLDVNKIPHSQERHIQFFWHPVNALDEVAILPKSLSSAIPKWIQKEDNYTFLFSEI